MKIANSPLGKKADLWVSSLLRPSSQASGLSYAENSQNTSTLLKLLVKIRDRQEIRRRLFEGWRRRGGTSTRHLHSCLTPSPRQSGVAHGEQKSGR